MTRLVELLRDRRGANMAEYVMVLALVFLVCVLAFTQLGSTIHDRVRDEGNVVEEGSSN